MSNIPAAAVPAAREGMSIVLLGLALAWEDILHNSFSGAIEPILTGTVFGLAGGFAAAAVPWGREAGWGLPEAIKSLLLGPVGAILAGLLLPEIPWLGVGTWFVGHPNAVIGAQILCAYMAQKWLNELRAVKLKTVIQWVTSKRLAPPSTSPAEDDK